MAAIALPGLAEILSEFVGGYGCQQLILQEDSGIHTGLGLFEIPQPAHHPGRWAEDFQGINTAFEGLYCSVNEGAIALANELPFPGGEDPQGPDFLCGQAMADVHSFEGMLPVALALLHQVDAPFIRQYGREDLVSIHKLQGDGGRRPARVPGPAGGIEFLPEALDIIQVAQEF